MKIGIAIALLAQATQAVPKQPNGVILDCSGTSTRISMTTGERSSPFSRRYLVDYDNGSYCTDDCKYVVPLKSLTATSIVFISYSEDKDRVRTIASETVDRVSGVLSDTMVTRNDPVVGDYAVTRKGICTASPFAGFPTSDPAPAPQTRF